MNGKRSSSISSMTSTLLTRQGNSYLDDHADNQPGHNGLGGTKERGGCTTHKQITFLQVKGTCSAFRVLDFWWPQYHDSDHQAVVATIHVGNQQLQLKAFQKQCQKFPMQLPLQELWDDLTTTFETLKATCEVQGAGGCKAPLARLGE
jgi:hypothetical protein